MTDKKAQTALKSEKEESHRALKAVVIGMGLALIGGLILLFILSWQKMVSPEKFAKKVPIKAVTECNLQAEALIKPAPIKEIMTFEKSISLMWESEGMRTWVSIDRCTGEEISRVIVKSQ